MEIYSAVSIYVVAHQDDWQLFMTPDAYNDLIDSDKKTVFIYTTAGDAGRDSVYWLASTPTHPLQWNLLIATNRALDTKSSIANTRILAVIPCACQMGE